MWQEPWGEKKCFRQTAFPLPAASPHCLEEGGAVGGLHTSLAEETDICLRTVFLTLHGSQECFLIQREKCASAKKYEIKIQAY